MGRVLLVVDFSSLTDASLRTWDSIVLVGLPSSGTSPLDLERFRACLVEMRRLSCLKSGRWVSSSIVIIAGTTGDVGAVLECTS